MTDDLRCSVITKGLGERPAGSAGGAERYILVELPLPWPKKIDRHLLIAEATQAPLEADSPTSTILGIRRTDEPSTGSHRIIVYDRRQPFDGFNRRELSVETTGLADAVASLVVPALGDLSVGESAADADLMDVLLCTHGSRDRCCGQLGTRLHIELDGSLGPNVRLWRTSHTGGHRFAPTGIVFPAGDTWAYLDADLARGIVTRSIDTTELVEHYRGNVGITGRPEQIVDGLAFLDRGWDWLAQPRMVSSVTEDLALQDSGSASATAEVTASVVTAAGRLDATMVAEDPLPVPVCGEAIEISVKATPQYRVTDRSWS